MKFRSRYVAMKFVSFENAHPGLIV